MKSIAAKILLTVGIATIFYSIFLLYHSYSTTNRRVNELVAQEALMALKFNLAIRKYIGEHVRPVMYDLLGPDEFMPETMSTSYVSRSIFEDVRKDFPGYIIKFSSDNPRNPVNQAGPEELKILEYLNDNPDIDNWEGIVAMDGVRYMAKFRARRMKESCLRCHGDPNDAPTSLLETYGAVAGFHRKLGTVIGSDTIAIPIENITHQLQTESVPTLLWTGLSLIIFSSLIIFTIRFLITKRLTLISQHFLQAAQQKDYANINRIDIKGRDEISDLAFSFNLLTDKLKNFYSSLEMEVKDRSTTIEMTNRQLREEITEREKVEQTAIANAERFRTFFSSVNDAIFVHPYQEEGFAPFIEINDIACERYGYSREEFLQRTALDITKRVYAETHSRKNHRSELLKKGHFVFEALHKKKSGETFPVEINSNVFYQFDEPYILAVVRDITERKQADKNKSVLETQLQQSQKMEAIGTLAGGIAHDFNNILSSIVGYSDLLLLDIPEKSSQRKYLEQILKAGNRAKDLVKQILMFSRQTDQEIRPIKIHHVLKEVIKLSRSTLPTTIHIKQDIPKDTGMVMADPTQVHQIVMNLVTNAFHAMAETGGTLTIVFEDVDLSADNLPEPGLAAGPYVCLTIADTGTGMDNETRKKIFEPYFTTKERDKGTGLGLAVVHGIITGYKGTILVDSQPGKGTTFKVYIPRIVSEIEDRDEIEPTPFMTGDERVLLVDDEEPITMMTKIILERVGYKVTARNSSTDTLAAFKSSPHKFDLVITDMTMPNMTGDKLATEIKKIRPDIPIILCTGFSEKVNEAESTLIGIDKIIMKPITSSELTTVVRAVLDEKHHTK